MIYVDFKEASGKMVINGDIEVLVPYKEVDGTAVFCCMLNAEEVKQVNETGVIYIKQSLTPDVPLTIIHDTVLKEDVMNVDEDDKNSHLLN